MQIVAIDNLVRRDLIVSQSGDFFFFYFCHGERDDLDDPVGVEKPPVELGPETKKASKWIFCLSVDSSKQP